MKIEVSGPQDPEWQDFQEGPPIRACRFYLHPHALNEQLAAWLRNGATLIIDPRIANPQDWFIDAENLIG